MSPTYRFSVSWTRLLRVFQALSLLGTVADIYEVANGAGKHIENLPPAMRSGFLKWTLVAETELVIATCLIKLSVCIFVLRFINRTRKRLQYCIYILMAFMIVSTVGLVIALLVQCRPVAALYDPHVKGKCYSKHVLFSVAYVQGGKSPQQSVPMKLSSLPFQPSVYLQTFSVRVYLSSSYELSR